MWSIDTFCVPVYVNIFISLLHFFWCIISSIANCACWCGVFSQPAKPIQAEVDVKISGVQCNLIISRIKPLIRVNSDKKKPVVLRENAQQEKAPKEKIALVWACTLSVPELTIVLYGLDDLPLYNVSTLLCFVLYCSVLIWTFRHMYCITLLFTTHFTLLKPTQSYC